MLRGKKDSCETVSIVIAGSGGTGAVTAGQLLLEAAGRAGWYGIMARTAGPQIRGGESAALVRLGESEVEALDDAFDIFIAFDWENVDRFAAEIPLKADTLVLADPAMGEPPSMIGQAGAKVTPVPFGEIAKGIPNGRANTIALGILSDLLGIPVQHLTAAMAEKLGSKGGAAIVAGEAGILEGQKLAAGMDCERHTSSTGGEAQLTPPWNVSGNELSGLGALKGGIRFSAAYPITPATEILEWLAPRLEKLGGALVQAEDELASINMILGSSFGGKPSITATSGPGLALMTESLGLGVAAELPIVIANVMRGGPSTGIPTKSEQSDLEIALYGLHGDAPHLVTAAHSVSDCLGTMQWSVHLAEKLQCPVIVLTDQFLGQTRAVIPAPADLPFTAERKLASAEDRADGYNRYAVTEDGISPMSLPGMPDGEYVADGLEHNSHGTPSTKADDHQVQLAKRLRKLDGFDPGDFWAETTGEGPIAILTWGSATGACREAQNRFGADRCRLISPRLLSPAQPDRMAALLAGVERVLVVEQTHSGQFHRYLRAHYELPVIVDLLNQPGPLPIRPGEVLARLTTLDNLKEAS
ncbi:MAG: 2-oxoacid:acceptor oxidoreductase subunit alpha [Magnetovibrionaceae bacterium]